MTSTEHLATPTRRERQRQATFEEIVTVSRTLLRAGDKPTLRAVAGEMGMTPPALYRYVDSHQDLLTLVCRSIFDDVMAALTAARDRFPDDDPAAQVVVSAVAFRRWALAHPEEFGMIFASRDTRDDATYDDEAVGALAFGRFFGDMYVRLWQCYDFPVPAERELQPEVVQAIAEHGGPDKLPCDGPAMPLGLTWVFMRAWARLYGTVTLEVFRHMDDVLIDSGAIFAAMMEDNAEDLNLGDDRPRLRDLVRQEMTAPTA